MIAALFVEKGGVYYGLPDVDPWDVTRDARKYAGPHPVVAHPPCDRWCQQAQVNQARYGHRVGDDGGNFWWAKTMVEVYGGVLEHPALSLAWDRFKLKKPSPHGGWTYSGHTHAWVGWTAHVEQRNYGHRARKATWLYLVLPHGHFPPELRWGKGPAPEAWISTDRPRAELAARGIAQLSKREAKATPLEFRDDVMLRLARSTRPAAQRKDAA